MGHHVPTLEPHEGPRICIYGHLVQVDGHLLQSRTTIIMGKELSSALASAKVPNASAVVIQALDRQLLNCSEDYSQTKRARDDSDDDVEENVLLTSAGLDAKERVPWGGGAASGALMESFSRAWPLQRRGGDEWCGCCGEGGVHSDVLW